MVSNDYSIATSYGMSDHRRFCSQHFNSGCRDQSSYQQSMSPSATQCCNENSKN
jgi:hypothetical protein